MDVMLTMLVGQLGLIIIVYNNTFSHEVVLLFCLFYISLQKLKTNIIYNYEDFRDTKSNRYR